VTYLSVDLDYWWQCHRRRDVDSFFSHVFSLHVPIFVAPFHDQLLEHINQSKYDHIINVDYHSDICDYAPWMRLNEGTWANFVQSRSHFDWRYPTEACLSMNSGYCHDEVNPFEKPEAARWCKTTCQQGLRSIPWRDITAVGVCLSKDWLDGNYYCLMNVLKTLQIKEWLEISSLDQRLCIRPRFL
jgi:hypothetical protein